MEISKELLSIMIGEKAYDVKCVSDNIISFYTDYDQYEEINIYELAHKCKEWAYRQGFIINSGATTSNDWSSTIYKVIKENPYIKELSHTWEQSEPETIFKACQWILDNKIKG